MEATEQKVREVVRQALEDMTALEWQTRMQYLERQKWADGYWLEENGDWTLPTFI